MDSWVERLRTYNTRIMAGKFIPGGDEERNFLVLALAGEAGELANALKKILRGDTKHSHVEYRQNLLMELADVIMYSALLADNLGVNIDDICTEKLDQLEYNERVGWK